MTKMTVQPNTLAAIHALKAEFEYLRKQQEVAHTMTIFGGRSPSETKESDERQKRIMNVIEWLTAIESDIKKPD
jgi:hypothetical protein